MNQDPRGMMLQQNGIMRIDNALVEEVSAFPRTTGYLIVSYSVQRPNQIISMEQLRLNVNRNTVILDPSGSRICLCDIRKGMWIDTLFSAAMTRSIPPQSNAFLIIVRSRTQPQLNLTTDRIASVDARNRFLITGNRNNINTQIKFMIPDSTPIIGRNGNPIALSSLRSGQLVKIIHATFMTASIPPQTTAYYVQVLS